MSDRRRFRRLATPHLILPGLTGLIAAPVAVPGSITITANQNFTVPFYNTITFDLYGAGGGGSVAGPQAGDGTATTIAALGLTANGGFGGSGPATPATATGFNTTSTNGTTNVGLNGCAGVGPLGGASVVAGVDGNIYGGGGGAGTTPGGSFGDGGEGGAYGRHVLVRTSGVLAVGTILAVVIGVGGIHGSPFGAVEPGDGAQGACVISWV